MDRALVVVVWHGAAPLRYRPTRIVCVDGHCHLQFLERSNRLLKSYNASRFRGLRCFAYARTRALPILDLGRHVTFFISLLINVLLAIPL